MTDYLIFHLYGPIASWGDIAVGETRPSYSYPTKSAIMGLLAAAIGIERNQEDVLLTLNQAYGFAVQVDAVGEAIQDYHTVQVPSKAALKKMPHATRKDELAIENLGTILSSRTYFCDAVYKVALWQKTNVADYSLQQLQTALIQPTFVLYLGRKSCPLSLPVQASIIKAASIQLAMQQKDKIWQELIDYFGLQKQLIAKSQQRLYWDTDGANEGCQIDKTIIRQDQLLSRKRWQYKDRLENVSLGQSKG